MMRRILLTLLTLGLTAGQTSDMNYMVFAPAVMHHPNNDTVCVHITSPGRDTTVTVQLRTLEATTVLTALTYMGDGQLQCVPFQVPSPTGGKEELATIETTVNCGDIEESQSKAVLIQQMRDGMFIQTDRPIYQPGEKINARAVHFDENLVASNDMFQSVVFEDSQGNMIKQWQNVQPDSGILSLTINLSPDIAVGNYTFTARKGDLTSHVTITVDKQVLPKFDHTIDAPSEVTILQASFPMKCCGKYTYGKPVKGQVYGFVRRRGNPNFGNQDIGMVINGVTDVNGCYTTFLNPDDFKFRSFGYDNYIEVEVTLTEDGTGVERKAQTNIFITAAIAKVDFKRTSLIYKPGLKYQGQVTLKGADGSPLPDEDIELYVNQERADDVYTTNADGIARFTLDTDGWAYQEMDLRAHYLPRAPLPDTGEVLPEYIDGYINLSPFYALGVSQLKIRDYESASLPCNEKVTLWADVSLDRTEHPGDSVLFHYVVIAEGMIRVNAVVKYTCTPGSEKNGFFSFTLDVTSKLFPAVNIFIYAALSSGKFLADSIKIPVLNCYPNQVSLQFSEAQTLPGSTLSLHISALPNSLCSVRSVDKSIELLKAEEERAEDTVNGFLNQWDTSGYPDELKEFQVCPPGSLQTDSQKIDPFHLIESCAMKVLTNFVVRQPLTCVPDPNIDRPPFTWDMLVMAAPPILSTTEIEFAAIKVFTLMPPVPVSVFQPIPTIIRPVAPVRKSFPSTWLMDLVSAGAYGQIVYPVTAADTITQWNTDAFCLAPDGLGFSPRTSLEVFKPLFVEVTIPHCVQQEESFVLTATAMNYMRQCIKVIIALQPSGDFYQETCADCSYTACLCSEITHTVTWTITPLILGPINFTVSVAALDTEELCDGLKPVVPRKGSTDTVQKSLLVEAAGFPVEKTRSYLLCTFESKMVALDNPEDLVLGSLRAELTVTGDIMGRSLSSLDNLVRMPCGCGEQNMIYMAPMIAALEYYSVTGQLTDEILAKATQYMETGYQNELNFKRDDGSYSVWGRSDASGSTWLTAFVARFFYLSQRFIPIDIRHIEQALQWLRSLQQDDGCFQRLGIVIHKELQGGDDNQISLSAFVTMTFLVMEDPQYEDVIQKAKQCLIKSLEPETTIYTKALCAYTYTLSGDEDKREQLLAQLDEVAIKTESQTYWSNKGPGNGNSEITSADVETTAYVLSALVSGQNRKMGEAVPVVHWLNSQQNANGGFKSTQDTVVALLALAQYGYLTYTAGSSPIVSVTNDNGFNSVVSVLPDKLMEVQTVQLPDIPGVYTLEVSGSGCAYIQITERYNIKTPKAKGIFSLSVETTSITSPSHPIPSFTMTISVSFNSNAPSNMAIVHVKLLSGFIAVQESLDLLVIVGLARKTQSNPSEVFLYLDKIGPYPTQLSFQMEQQSQVNNLMPAMVSVCDYYDPSYYHEAFYQAPSFNPVSSTPSPSLVSQPFLDGPGFPNTFEPVRWIA